MSKVKKKDPNKRGLSPQTKRTLGNVFKSLILNQSCIDGAKESPWWIAVIFLVFSIVLPVLPTFVNATKAYGASFVSGANYGLDRGLANTTQELHANGYEFKVSGGYLTFEQNGAKVAPTDDPIAVDKIGNNYNFLMYITEYRGADYTTFKNTINNQKYILGTTDLYVEGATYADDTQFYKPSYMILSTTSMEVHAYKSLTTTAAVNGPDGLNWNNVKNGDILAAALDVAPELTNAKRTEAIFNKWKTIFNDAYIDARKTSILNVTLIYLGVYAGLILFLGVLVFLLTRGKNNMYRDYSFFLCQKITWWAAFTPAVLGMIVGWIFGTNIIGQMGFIVFLSLRVMWLSMRQLRPM